MEFPRYVFVSPGRTLIPGGSYGSELVQNREEYEVALGAGYSATVTEALDAAKRPEVLEAPPAPVVLETLIDPEAEAEVDPEPKPASKRRPHAKG